MANKIILKRSSVAAKVPLATDLDVGELAVNLADAKLYSKNASGTVISVGGGGTSANTANAIVARDASGNFSAGTITAALSGNATTATTANNVSGTVAIANGGTGQTTATAAFDALAPTTTNGDTIYHNGTDNVRLAGNTTTTKKFLRQTGTGTVSAAPAWDTVTATDVGLGNVTNDAQLKIASNLSDLNNASTARTNLGLGSAATMTGPTGAIVGTTDTQTLTNKTISGGTVTGAVVTGLATPAASSDAATKAYVDTIYSSTYYDQSELFSGSKTSLVLPDIKVVVNGTLVRVAGATLALGTAGNWDNSTYATAANRAGKDFYVYAKESGGVILSANSTYPTGYTAANTRKIGGFHCLCVDVGTISGHTLTGYVAGDILPRSVWDRFNRSSATQEGRVLSRSGKWVMIYLPSVSGSTLVSVNGGTIADGVSTPAFHAYKFEQWLARQGEMSIGQLEFFAASDGANQGTNIAGSTDPGTTTGHTDTAGRRMISNEGIEDACGVVWQWTRDQGGVTTGASWANAFDANDSGVGGRHYQAPCRGLLGGVWNFVAICGSRASLWSSSPLALSSDSSVRGVAEPAVNRF